MNKIYITLLVMVLCGLNSFASDSISYHIDSIQIKVNDGELSATFLQPESNLPVSAVLIIAGSGPTDRNGNNPFMQNNSLKMLAEDLAVNNIASLRYDKRGIGASNGFNIIEDSLRFEHYINDAIACVNFLSTQEGIDKIYIAGHSEGALIGMVATTKTNIAGYISIAGMGEPIHTTILRQLEAQPKYTRDTANIIMSELLKGNQIQKIDPMLNSIFRPSLQPFLISYFQFDPAEIIKKIEVPTLIIQGTTDIQIRLEDAEILHKALPSSELVVIEKMNHVLKFAESDRSTNLSTYNNPGLPLIPELIPAIIKFIHQH